MTKQIPDPTKFSEADIQTMIAQDAAGEFDYSQATPIKNVTPEGFTVIHPNKGGRPRVEHPKQQISIRLDPAVIDKFKATGRGWQGRMNDVLAAADLNSGRR